MKRLAPETVAAARVRWDIFLTLTWRGETPRSDTRRRKVIWYLRYLSAMARVPFPRLIWFAREEHGEKFGRVHFHLLIGGLPSHCLGFDFGFRLGHLWPFGFSEGRLCFEGLGALGYSGEMDARDVYESGKFLSNRPIMLSESLARVVGLATGDNVEREDAKHREQIQELNASSAQSNSASSQAKDQKQLFLTSLVAEGKGYLASVNVSRTEICYNRADIAPLLFTTRR